MSVRAEAPDTPGFAEPSWDPTSATLPAAIPQKAARLEIHSVGGSSSQRRPKALRKMSRK